MVQRSYMHFGGMHLHRSTSYSSGHDDLMSGLLVVATEDRADRENRMETVLIVDDQRYFCQHARQVLSRSDRFTVVGESYGALEALDLVATLQPDVVLMDVEMEGVNGIEATALIRNRYPTIRVVLMSVYDEKEYTRLAEKVGAIAFISKKDFSVMALAEVLDQRG